jgi:hypothetical protein
MTSSLNLYTAGTKLAENDINAALVNDTHTLGRKAQTHKTILGLDPETVMLQIRQEATTGFVVCMGNVVPGNRTLTSYLTDSRHTISPLKPHAQPGMGWLLKLKVIWRSAPRFFGVLPVNPQYGEPGP